MLRLPDGMRERIKRAAEENNRSMNAEIVAALEERYPEQFSDEEILEMVASYSFLLAGNGTGEKQAELDRQYRFLVSVLKHRLGDPDPEGTLAALQERGLNMQTPTTINRMIEWMDEMRRFLAEKADDLKGDAPPER